MRKNVSVYLDLIRWLSAIGVYLCHAGYFVMPAIPKELANQGTECVAVFFVLSGLVIRHVSSEKEKDWRQYLTARLARLSSVVLLALAVTVAADMTGLAANPGAYIGKGWFSGAYGMDAWLSSLTFSGEFWFRHVVVGSNEPYWSLGFEVPYYALFGAAAFARGRWRAALIVLWALAVGPKVLAYLPLWLLGVLVRDLLRRRPFALRRPRLVGLGLIAASIAIYAADKYLVWANPAAPMFAPHAAKTLLHSAAYFSIIGVAVAANIVGFDLMARDAAVWNPRVSWLVRWLAGSSFTLYLVHQPLLVAAAALFPGALTSPAAGAAASVAVFVLVLVLAELGERRKLFFRRIIGAAVLPPVSRPSSVAPEG